MDVSHLPEENVHIPAEYDSCTYIIFYHLMALRDLQILSKKLQKEQ